MHKAIFLRIGFFHQSVLARSELELPDIATGETDRVAEMLTVSSGNWEHEPYRQREKLGSVFPGCIIPILSMMNAVNSGKNGSASLTSDFSNAMQSAALEPEDQSARSLTVVGLCLPLRQAGESAD